MSSLRKINKDRLAAFLKHLENKNTSETFEKCLVILKTLLYTSSNFTYDTTLNTQFSVQTFLSSVNFDAIERDHIIKLKPIIDEVADIVLYAQYIESILNKNDNTLNSILVDIWSRLGSNVLKLPKLIHEKSIEVNPVIFEKTILFALSLSQISDLVDVCSKSPIVFQACSSIFNELLIKLNFTDKFMDFLINFVNSVSSQCEKNNIDIIDLYPIKCRSILTLRAIKKDNSSLVSNHYLNEEVKQLILDYPKESMCLLSHFPDLYVSY